MKAKSLIGNKAAIAISTGALCALLAMGITGCTTSSTAGSSSSAASSASSSTATQVESSSAATQAESSSNAASTSANTTPTTDVDLTSDDALVIALNQVGLKESEVDMIQNQLDYDDGLAVYEIEFHGPNNTEYEFEIDANTGEVISFESDTIDD